MACVASQLIEEVTAHAQSDSLEDVREICADGTYFPNSLRNNNNNNIPLPVFSFISVIISLQYVWLIIVFLIGL